jgi:hypothetical protein
MRSARHSTPAAGSSVRAAPPRAGRDAEGRPPVSTEHAELVTVHDPATGREVARLYPLAALMLAERLVAQAREILHLRAQQQAQALTAAELTRTAAVERAVAVQTQLVEHLQRGQWCPRCVHCAPPPPGHQSVVRRDGESFDRDHARDALRQLVPQSDGSRRPRRIA